MVEMARTRGSGQDGDAKPALVEDARQDLGGGQRQELQVFHDRQVGFLKLLGGFLPVVRLRRWRQVAGGGDMDRKSRLVTVNLVTECLDEGRFTTPGRAMKKQEIS